MSRYEWPNVGVALPKTKDALDRDRFVARRRSTLDRTEVRSGEVRLREPTAPGRTETGSRPVPRAPASGSTNLWQPLGPATLLGGAVAGSSRLAGRIHALAVHPDGDRVYAASANAGVFYSRDGGAHWESLGGFDATNTAGIKGSVQRNACSSIEVAFGSGAAPDVVYVGTGEVLHPYGISPERWMSGQTGRPFGGIGILRCERAANATGANWEREAKNLIGNGVYRIALEPGGTGVIAATLTGLYQRPAVAGPDSDWVRLSGSPFDTLDVECTDILWTAAAGARPARVWVWVESGTNAGLWVRATGQTDFTRVETPGTRGRRAVLAASTPPDQVWVLADQPDDVTVGRTAASGSRAAMRSMVAPSLAENEPCETTSDDVRTGFARLLGQVVPVTYYVIDGMAMIEGDIVLGHAEEIETLTAAVRAELDTLPKAAASAMDITAHGVLRGFAIVGQGFRWPGGIVPWTATARRDVALDAIGHWESHTRIRFVERTAANQAFYSNYVTFQSGTGCNSSVGMQGGQQFITLGDGCDVGRAVHEMGHALGLFHEQQRPDQAANVRIIQANVDPVHWAANFPTPANGFIVGPYDFGSIMHYERTAFSRNGQDTIVPLGGQSIGQRRALSPGDIAAIQNLYPDLRRPLLFRVTAGGAATPVARPVIGIPDVLTDQGFDAIALAVDPTVPNRVLLGGSGFRTTTPDNMPVDGAALVVADVSLVNNVLQLGGATNAFTMVGIGVPAGVHDLKLTSTGTRVWLACDGGVFRSDHPTSTVGFYPRNDGLHAAEVRQIAVHPSCEGRVIASLRGDVVAERISNAVWRLRDDGGGGGIAFDPLHPQTFIMQRGRGRWTSSDGSLTDDGLLSRAGAVARTEQDISAPYSVPATIAHRRGTPAPDAPNVTQLIVGTNRLWYSEDFGVTWVTLPSGRDPLPADLATDALGEPIVVCRWQSPDVAWVLCESRVMRYARTPGSDAGGGPGTWTSELVLRRTVKPKKDNSDAEGPIRDAVLWTDIEVNLDAPPAPGQPPSVHGTKGAIYLGTSGNPSKPDVDTLWWYDGTSKFYPTSLRSDAAPVPVTAIVCDPEFPEEVYVGTTMGVWKGIRTQVGNATPAWTWHTRLNGLPEAPVESLALFKDGGLRILRAGSAAGGVYELRLDVPDVQPLTYLRVHDDDLRQRILSSTSQRNGTSGRSWHGSPDVRPRTAAAAVPAPTTLPWTQAFFGFDNEALRRFQAALRARTGDPRVRATGEWDKYFDELLRELGAPIRAMPPNSVSIDAAFWNLSMVAPHATAEAWGTGTPNELDLLELTPELHEGTLERASCTLPPRASRVDIIVRHRGPTLDGANVRVTLLCWIDPRPRGGATADAANTWNLASPVPWTTAVNEVLNSASGATTATFGGGWSFVGTTPATRRHTLAGQTLDPLNPGIASFDLNLATVRRDRVVLLVAIVRAETDLALTADTLENLAINHPQVAVRSLGIL